jgi:2-keto-4-pentenoate hydratase/2-oxohepta-3-ene-1,7-dioic acid hydratase in catechol pathway
MRLCRFLHDGAARVGRIEEEKVIVCEGELLGSLSRTGETLELRSVRLLAPVLPGKIIGIGRNYAEHARELGNAPPEAEPLIFLKAPSSVLSPENPIVLPGASRRVDHEAELGVIIGRMARNLTEGQDPLAYVLGYACVNDVTARDLQMKDVQFTRAKSFDTFCPLGPWIETELDPTSVEITARVNGQTRQKGNTRDMIFPVSRLIRFLAGIMTLYPGDLIATGTPAGVAPLSAGDTVEVEVAGIGILRNPVIGGS